MHERSNLDAVNPSRPITFRSRRSSPHYDSPEDHSSDRGSHALSNRTEKGSSLVPTPQMHFHLEARGCDQARESLLESTGRTSPTCVSTTDRSDLVETVKPSDGPPPSSSILTVQQGHLSDTVTDARDLPILRNWKWELLSMVTSLGMLAGVIIMLGRYHLSEQPEWPYNININSLASVITAVIIAQMGFILAEGKTRLL